MPLLNRSMPTQIFKAIKINGHKCRRIHKHTRAHRNPWQSRLTLPTPTLGEAFAMLCRSNEGDDKAPTVHIKDLELFLKAKGISESLFYMGSLKDTEKIRIWGPRGFGGSCFQ